MKRSLLIALSLAAAAVTGLALARQDNAKQFAIFFYEPKGAFDQRVGAKSATYWKTWTEYIGGIQASGKMDGGSALGYPQAGTLITAKGTSQLDTKETQLSGFVLIHAGSLQEATEIGRRSPAIAEGGRVEVREILPMSQDKVVGR